MPGQQLARYPQFIEHSFIARILPGPDADEKSISLLPILGLWKMVATKFGRASHRSSLGTDTRTTA